MGKTNMELACGLALLAACGRTLTHQALRIKKALDKAEKRGRRKVCCEPAPPFDAAKVFDLIIALRDEAHRQGMRSKDSMYEDCVIKKQGELLDAIRIGFSECGHVPIMK